MSDTTTVQERIDTLADETPLTKRQAEAWVWREELDAIESDVADFMGVSCGTVRSHLGRARDKVRQAKTLLRQVERVPEDTAEALGERFA